MNAQDQLRDSLLKASPDYQRKFAVGIIRDLPRAERFRAIEELGASIERPSVLDQDIPAFLVPELDAQELDEAVIAQHRETLGEAHRRRQREFAAVNRREQRRALRDDLAHYAWWALKIAVYGGSILLVIAAFTAAIKWAVGN